MTFFSRFLSLFNGGMRAYKVQDVKREARIGVTAKNYQELLKKGCEKLKVCKIIKMNTTDKIEFMH